MTTLELIRRLSEAHGPSGYENDVRELILEALADCVDDILTDALGNLIVRRHARSQSAPVLLVDAHMDEVGFVVSHIEASGFLRLAPIGGWDERIVLAQRLEIRTRDAKKYVGIVGTTPPHIQPAEERKTPISLDNVFLDVGATSREEVAAWGIRIGDSVVPAQGFIELNNGVVAGKAFDDRLGCAQLIELFWSLAELPRLNIEVVGLFSTFEELNARGAMVGAFRIAPTLALVLEGTVAADVPGVPEARCPTRIGAGAA
ncbi:MAG: M42 family metallopeptidase, partial [Candidatus Sumerlaeaceae bacterium]